MKLFFSVLLAFFLLLPKSTQAQAIVFVQLGDKIPPCLLTSLQQARFFNESSPLYLLADKSAYEVLQLLSHDFFLREKIEVIDLSNLPLTLEHLIFQKTHKIEATISDGLWLYALERFFYLFDFLQELDLEEVIHLENDTMLYRDLEELLPIFQKAHMELAAPFQSPFECIPCFVFIKNSGSLRPFLWHALQEIEAYKGPQQHVGLTDMSLLASFYQKFGENYMSQLPTLMPTYTSQHTGYKTPFALMNTTPRDFLSTNSSLFSQTLFDAATLGIFIAGSNPIYFPNKGPGTIDWRSMFNPRLFSFFWGVDAKNRAIPYLSFQGQDYAILNLHFFSKRPQGYTSYTSARLSLTPPCK